MPLKGLLVAVLDTSAAKPARGFYFGAEMKQCPNCKEIKPFGRFNKNKSKPDGLQNYCKVCQAIKNHKYNQSSKGKTRIKRIRKTEQWKVYQDRYSKSDKGRTSNLRKVLKYDKNNPAVKKAHDAVYYARKTGKLPNPEILNCAECGNRAAEYHHYKGYSKENRLNVVPVCTKCHSEITRSNHIPLEQGNPSLL